MELTGKKVIILGLGRSGLAAAQLVLAQGARPLISDSAPLEKVQALAEKCAAAAIPFETGGHSPEALADADLFVVSPGIPTTIPPLRDAIARGIPVVGELELASRFCNAPLLAVTGTNGKTTTTELLAAILKHGGLSVALAGNNATALSAFVCTGRAVDYAVVEVSSYQLETVSTFHPRVSAILNLSPDHLARHGAMADYGAAKGRIMAQQGPGDVAVLNGDDPFVAAMPTPPGLRRRCFSMSGPVDDGFWWDGAAIREGQDKILETAALPMPGRHNVANVLAALTMVQPLGLPWEKVIEAVLAFPGVEHRIEYVCTRDGVKFYNDSKSTNVDSLRVALESFDAPIVLIAGGLGKGAPYDSVLDLVHERVSAMITIGDEAPILEKAFGTVTRCVRGGTMEEAVLRAREIAQAGEVVLLSPACASFDAYSSFEERGRHFKACILAESPDGACQREEEPCEKK